MSVRERLKFKLTPSFAGACRACNSEACAYLVHVPTELPQRVADIDVADLLPFSRSPPSGHRYGEAVFQHQEAGDLRVGEGQYDRKRAVDQFSGGVDTCLHVPEDN